MSRSGLMVLVAVVVLTGCMNGTRTSGEGGVGLAPPVTPIPPVLETPPPEPTPVPTPEPTPTPVPSPTPVPTPPLPPLAPVIVDLNDNHTVGIRHWPDERATVEAVLPRRDLRHLAGQVPDHAFAHRASRPSSCARDLGAPEVGIAGIGWVDLISALHESVARIHIKITSRPDKARRTSG